MARGDTDERIVRAFLKLAAERGIDRATTREVAQAAGVNEVTIFRRFGDKQSLARAAIQHFHPANEFDAYAMDVDASSPGEAAAGVARAMAFVRDRLQDRHELLQFGLGEATRFPDLLDLIREGPMMGLSLVRGALQAAAPQLRREVDVEASALSLLGLVLLTVIWRSRGWLELDGPRWDGLFEAAVRPLMRGEEP
jgi:AcrR family transcriptional regulator